MRKVRRKVWEGNPIRIQYRETFLRWQLVLEGEDENAYAPTGMRDLLAEVAKPVAN
jgi:hypothetical protein